MFFDDDDAQSKVHDVRSKVTSAASASPPNSPHAIFCEATANQMGSGCEKLKALVDTCSNQSLYEKVIVLTPPFLYRREKDYNIMVVNAIDIDELFKGKDLNVSILQTYVM